MSAFSIFTAPMSSKTNAPLSSGRLRAAQPHHLQRRLSVCAIRWQSLAKCAGSQKGFTKGFTNAMTHALRIPTTTTNAIATVSHDWQHRDNSGNTSGTIWTTAGQQRGNSLGQQRDNHGTTAEQPGQQRDVFFLFLTPRQVPPRNNSGTRF